MNTLVAHVLRWGLVAMVALSAACGSKDEEPPRTKREAPAKLTIAEVLGDAKKPALLGPFAKASLGMTKEELAAAVPLFAEHGDYLSKQDHGIGFFAYLEGPNSDKSAKSSPRRLTSLSLSLTAADAKAVIAAWGTPTEVQHRGAPVSVWHDPAAKIRAELSVDKDDHKLKLERYVPAAEILGPPGQPLGVEGPRALIGSTPAELKAAYPDNFERHLTTLAFMGWLPDEYGDAFKMELRVTDDKVVSLQFWLHHGDNDAVKATLKALLEAKYGAATEVTSTLGRKVLQLAESPKVTINETKGAWVIEVGGR